MASNVQNILAGAKKVLADANKFSKSAGGSETPHEYSNAPYSLAAPKKKEGTDLGAELKAKKDNIDQYRKATE